MAHTDLAGMTVLHRTLFVAAVVGFLVVGVTEIFDPAWKPLIQVVAGGLGITLGTVVGLDIGGSATQFSAHRRQTVGGEQPYDSVTGTRIGHAAIFGGFGVVLILLGVWNILS